MKFMTLNQFLTKEELNLATDMWRKSRSNYAKRVCDQIISPQMQRINAALGQENEPMYLAYCVEYVMGKLIP